MSDGPAYFTMATDEVYQAGQQVAEGSTPAERLSEWFREELLTAEHQVRHFMVGPAVSEYREIWVGHARRTARLVRQLGDSTSAAAVTVDEADLEAFGQTQPVSHVVAGHQSLLSRPVDGSLVVT